MHNETKEDEGSRKDVMVPVEDSAMESEKAGASPEPPVRYDPQTADADGAPARFSEQPAAELQSISRLISGAQVTALVSLVFGGVLLSTASIAIAILGYRRVAAAQRVNAGSSLQGEILVRRARLAIALALLAFVLNLAAAIYLYPMVMEAVQSGDYASLLGTSGTTSTDPNSIWG